jgi:hypothetical protein
MKYIKVIAVAVLAMFAVEGAKAQVVVNAHIGTPAPRRTVIVERPVERRVIVERPVERRVVVVDRYHRRHPHYRETVVVERNRPYRRHVVVRHY